ncbi:hypothetical protein V511_00665 [Mesotoga sp. Brook.08.YT.4.2.5.1]|uniref:glycoside hydrolase family 172 protein n=1 Tax=unclassified Mesotoga TaxID=1184398 RepID=UPI000C17938F|nr:glycoside hydrolase family 172 protein [Mesotoga sp. Brook.08.YT.4.2.5.1]PNE23616.1 hypothetical protein V511_00665 [Mesotoga sp. Brook.08.YT.4.2.5.1]PNS36521.1 hypothetical protein RJ60_11885 [Mesotoga sp. B105.6.4]
MINLSFFGDICEIKNECSRSISAENPDGSVSGGALERPEGKGPARKLGQGWKVRPCIELPATGRVELARIEGPGTIRHIWITVDSNAYRSCLIRFYWDGEQSPSVEAPLGDFFGCTHGLRYNINSLPVAVNPSGGFNCYWPMPFENCARIEVENLSPKPFQNFFYQIDYSLGSIPESAAYFHAEWRRSMTTRECPEHVILDCVSGIGHYVGTVASWTQFSNGWWGEGEVKFFIDGEEDPSICTTGTEDYFGGAWCFGESFSAPFCGYPLWKRDEGQVPRHGLYRWHIPDPIRFNNSIRVTVQALGWYPDGAFQPLTDDIATVAYWYQREPHLDFSKRYSQDELWSR